MTRTTTGQHDRYLTGQQHPIAETGPCQGHPCDDCSTCRGGTCCGTVPIRICREGNPALSPEPYQTTTGSLEE